MKLRLVVNFAVFAVFFTSSCNKSVDEVKKKSEPQILKVDKTIKDSLVNLIFDEDDEVPVAELSDCIALALTYHLRKKAKNKRNKRAKATVVSKIK